MEASVRRHIAANMLPICCLTQVPQVATWTGWTCHTVLSYLNLWTIAFWSNVSPSLVSLDIHVSFVFVK